MDWYRRPPADGSLLDLSDGQLRLQGRNGYDMLNGELKSGSIPRILASVDLS